MANDHQPALRRYDIDWIRIIAVTVLILIHTAAIFDPYPITAVKGHRSFPLIVFSTFVHEWRLSILFIVSGASACFALRFLNPSQYLISRFKRIGIPLVFATLVIVPIHLYYWQFLGNPRYPKSYFSFYRTILVGFFAHGLFGQVKESLHWAHLWFLAYLFVAAIVALPLFIYLRSAGGQTLLTKLATIITPRPLVFLLAIPLIVVEVTLRAKWSGGRVILIDDWASFCSYLVLFIFGVIIFSEPRLISIIERERRVALVLGICTSLIYLLLVFTRHAPARAYSLNWSLFVAMKAVNVWFWCVTIFGFGSAFLNRNHALLRRANEGVYPVYVVHLPISTAIAYHVVRWNLPVAIQFPIIVLLTLSVSILIFEFVIRRTKLTRFLFGLKINKRPTSTHSRPDAVQSSKEPVVSGAELLTPESLTPASQSISNVYET